MVPSGTYFVGFNDLHHTRLLLRDMGLDPWRQKSKLPWFYLGRWTFDWLDVRHTAEDYADLGEQRKRNRRERRPQ
jgi:hypothetical protein